MPITRRCYGLGYWSGLLGLMDFPVRAHHRYSGLGTKRDMVIWFGKGELFGEEAHMMAAIHSYYRHRLTPFTPACQLHACDVGIRLHPGVAAATTRATMTKQDMAHWQSPCDEKRRYHSGHRPCQARQCEVSPYVPYQSEVGDSP